MKNRKKNYDIKLQTEGLISKKTKKKPLMLAYKQSIKN